MVVGVRIHGGRRRLRRAPRRRPPDADATADELLAALDAWAADGGSKWRDAVVEQSRAVAADAVRRAEAAERAAATGGATRDSAAAATAAASKRAGDAERFAAELATKLETAEKRNRELQWQVSMLTAPESAPEQPKGPGGWLAGAIKGCVAPRQRRRG